MVMKMKYKIEYIGDSKLENIHHIGIGYNGEYYSVIFGEYVNGGFFIIPNWNCGGELSEFDDVFWNTDSVFKSLKKKNAAKVIAECIAKYCRKSESEVDVYGTK